MGKSAKEWFTHLPEPIRSQAVANWEESNWDNRNNLFDSLDSALNTFHWSSTPQGQAHWYIIHSRAEAGEFDQPEPNQHGWISIKDRLPTAEDADKVGNVMIATDTVGIVPFVWVIANNAICPFWQPLPKLPEVKGGENV
jgi:hypothetical protein